MNRLKGTMPKIGIRPTIDGRRKGVRESLEEQTMDMARRTAEFLTANLRHSNGLPVECVIAPSCIGGVAEAAECADLFHRENVGVSITVTPCWCYGAETLDMDPSIPKAIWGFNGTERPGAVYLAAALAGYNQKGLPAFSIYGHDVQDRTETTIPEDIQEKLLRFARAALAVAVMKGKSYLAMGTVSMGIAGSYVTESFFQDYLGMRNEYIDMSEFTRRLKEEIYDKEEFVRAQEWVKANCKEGPFVDYGATNCPADRKDWEWETVIKMAMITRDLMVGNPKLAADFGEEALGHNAILAGFQGQRNWTDFMPNGDFLEGILNSSFDWNGIREPYLVATENDNLNGVAMLFGHLISNAPSVFCDVRTYWSPAAVQRVTGVQLEGLAKDGFIHLINSGSAALDGSGEMQINGQPAMKPYWDITPDDAKKCLDATLFRRANGGYFRGGGFSVDFMSKGDMPVTMSRINIVKGLGPVLQLAEGYVVNLPEKVATMIDERTDKTWPTTWFAPRLTGKGAFCDVYSVMANWGANHSVYNYGHIGADLITLASILRIPVCMHNVEDESIFRPTAWNAFGTADSEGADYRACQNFGPLYGTTR